MNLKLLGRYKIRASLCAVTAALLVVAAPAAAEVRTGQTTAAANPAIPAEADIVAASASYDSTAGTISFSVTTAAPPIGNPAFTTVCILGPGEHFGVPEGGFLGPYGSPTGTVFEAEVPETPAFEGPVTQSVSGGTKTWTTTESAFTNKPYAYALVGVIEENGEEEPPEIDYVTFPIAAAPPPAPPPPPAPAPPTLEIGKPRPVKAAARHWTNVSVTIANAGGTATSPITLKVKAPKGIELNSGNDRYTVPALEPGTQEKVYFKAKVGEVAKPKSRLIVSAAASGQRVETSVVLDSVR